jgi:tetratricopeptide (TPR) repeat protein
LLEESIPDYQAIEDKEGVALNLNNLGDLSRQSGNLKTAEVFYAQAKATAKEIDDQNAIAYIMNGQGDVFLDRGDLRDAREAYEEALKLRTQAGEKQLGRETETALAALSLEEGHATEAESTARNLRQQFQQEKASDDELMADIVLVKALLTEAKQADAEHELEAVRNLAEKSQNKYARLQFELAEARVKVSSNHPSDSRPLLTQINQETRRSGFLGLQLEERLFEAELANKLGQHAEANGQLIAVENSARAAGFGLISAKADSERRLARTPPGL